MDPAALIPMGTTVDIGIFAQQPRNCSSAECNLELPPLDNFDFTSSEVPITQATFSSTQTRVSCEEPIGRAMLHGQHRNTELQNSTHVEFCNTAGCHPEVEERFPVPYLAPITTPISRTSKRKREPVSSDPEISLLKKSPSSSVRINKQSTDVEESLHGTQGRRGSKTAHSIVERKYRENIKSKITQLQQSLLVTDYFSQEGSQLSDEALALSVAKPRKGDVLESTIGYIQHAEIDKKHMSEEIKLLRSQIAAMRRLTRCGDWPVTTPLRALRLQVPVEI